MAINSRMTAAKVSIVFSETRLASQRPRRTPIKLVVIRAKAAPKKTTQGESDSAVMRRVVSWVLSPISAKKMVIKVEPKIPRMDFEALRVERGVRSGGSWTGEDVGAFTDGE